MGAWIGTPQTYRFFNIVTALQERTCLIFLQKRFFRTI